MPRLLYLVTEDWAFCSHRLPMALAAQKAGFDVGIICRVSDHGAIIKNHGFTLHALNWQRRSLNPLTALKNIIDIAKIYRAVKPDLVHHVAMKPVIFGTVAAQLARVPAIVNALVGLGFLFTSEKPKAKILRPIIIVMLRLLYGFKNVFAIMQNRDDMQLLTDLKILRATRTRLIRGSGIELDYYQPLPEPPSPPAVFGFVGRILDDKGVRALIEAFKIAQKQVAIGLILAGTPDPENPASIPESEILQWTKIPGIEWRGKVDDIRTVWQDCHVGILPSRREGLPKSLMEAAACQRALITTDVPGCREIVEHNVNGLLVPMDDAQQMASAMIRLANDAELRSTFATASRAMVESDLSSNAVGASVVALYRQALSLHLAG